jgi:hypothetical protein
MHNATAELAKANKHYMYTTSCPAAGLESKIVGSSHHKKMMTM